MHLKGRMEGLGRGLVALSPALVYLALTGRRWQRVASETSRIASFEFGTCFPEQDVLQLRGISDAPSLKIDVLKCSIGIPDLVGILQCAKSCGKCKVFEFGTATGGTTWHLATNAAPGSEIHTLDLDTALPRIGKLSEQSLATCRPTKEVLGEQFRGTCEQAHIIQHVGDSRLFDTTPFEESIDLAFIDAGHTYDLVKNDTIKAFEMVKEGGIIAWHDYFVFHPDYGVRSFLHRLGQTGVKLFRFKEGLAAYCVIRKSEWARAQDSLLRP
jgi:hypothetical protein